MHFFDILNKLRFFWVSGATSLRRPKGVSSIYVPVATSLRHLKFVSLIYVTVGTSLWRLKLIDFIQVPVRGRDNVPKMSVLLTYQ